MEFHAHAGLGVRCGPAVTHDDLVVLGDCVAHLDSQVGEARVHCGHHRPIRGAVRVHAARPIMIEEVRVHVAVYGVQVAVVDEIVE